jgi:hypothetical protein
MMQQWFDLESQHPSLISHEKIGDTVEGNSLYVFRVGKSNGGAVMWDGCTHGCEDTGTEASHWFSRWLVKSNTKRALSILAGNYWLVIPYVNYDRADGRTNMHKVNLNRNFITGWGTSGSNNPNDLRGNYRGPAPASEPETQALRYAMNKYRPQVYFNVHCGYHLVYYDGINRNIASIGSDIKQRYAKEIQTRAVRDRYSRVWSQKYIGAGNVSADAYSFGACAFLLETQRWTELPKTLDEWKSQWYPSIESLIFASLEAVQKI